MKKKKQKFIIKQGIIILVILILAGCYISFGEDSEHKPPKDYKEFQTRSTEFFDVLLNTIVTVTFEVYDVDDFVGWYVDCEIVDVKLIDPKGNLYPYKRTSGPFEGSGKALHFKVQNPISGQWKMVFSQARKIVHCCVWMYAYSDTEGAYNKLTVESPKTN